MRKRTGILAAALFTALAFLFAFSVPSQAYVGIKAGAFLPNDDEDGLDGFDTGYSVEGFYGYELTPNFALEAGIGYYHTEGSQSGYDPVEGLSYHDDATIKAVPLTLTAKGTYVLQQGFCLFAGAGVGAYFATAEEDLSVSDGRSRFSGDDDDTDTAFGFHVVAGGEYKLASGMAVLGEFKWFAVEPEFELFKDVLDDYPGDVKIGGIVLSLGVKF